MSGRMGPRIGYIMLGLPAAMTNHWFLATVLFYTASWAGYVAFLATSRREAGRMATLLLAAGLVAHYLALVERSRGAHTVPYNDLYGSLSLFAWLLAATYLGLEFFHRQRSVGAFVLPVVLIVLFFSEQRALGAGDSGSRRRTASGPAHHHECPWLRGVRALVCLEPDLPGAESALAASSASEHRLAVSRARDPGAHEPQRRRRGLALFVGRDRIWADVVPSHLWAVLERRSRRRASRW